MPNSGPARYWVPLAALVDTDSPEQAHQTLVDLLAQRTRDHPDHPIELILGPLNEVKQYADSPRAKKARTRK